MYFSLEKNGLDITAFAGFVNGTPQTDTAPSAYGISIDSRTAKAGDAFFALKGENFDGHRFIPAAAKAGCVFAVVEYIPENCEIPCILVKNTTEALGAFARSYKNLFRPITLAVTGSVGKTTTKQFIFSVLETKYRTNVTKGNFNNEIGLPLTVLNLNADHRALLLEMGMNHKGEISYLSHLAEPDIAVITNIGSSHMENLGSREGIRDAKMEIVDGMREGGILILNANEPLLRDVPAKGLTKIYVGAENENATYSAENIRILSDRMLFDLRMRGLDVMKDVRVDVIGKHHIHNALTAAVCGMLLGISEEDIRRGLLNFVPADMRQSISEKNGMTVIEDCYNASPESMRAGLDVLCHTARVRERRPVAVLGDMKELGAASAEAHFGVGQYAAQCGVERLITFGSAAAEIARGAAQNGMPSQNILVIENAEDAEAAVTLMKTVLRENDAVLFKASRAVALERLVRLL
ncbi:MAG: UDP-N-acetylmuramoyl-tripeptide--D-alanyl-D-alanine ligase [Clostridia bacterium]|nr:UDP-N-acetylmuramoyl-tripeptide--D-alanyl-D-alanine ligase [Clostridia bacterium]